MKLLTYCYPHIIPVTIQKTYLSLSNSSTYGISRKQSPQCTTVHQYLPYSTRKKIHNCGGSYLVILNIFIFVYVSRKYGASEAIYLCNVVEKIHQYLRPKMRQMF
jgi:hypothetical protein